MRLSLEEDFDGSRGYGRLDYVVHCHDIAVLVTEAKMESMGKGVVQNIIQLHTAAEVPKNTLSVIACYRPFY
jgi:hypothetical protein